MKILKKFIIFLGIIFIILTVSLLTLFAIIKHLKIKEILESEIKQSLGINVTISKIDFSPLLTRIGAKGITIYNPPGFIETELAYIESIQVVFDPLEVLIRKKPNIYLFALDLKRLSIIKNKDGKVNLKEIIPVKEKNTPKETETPFYFDVVVLSVGEVRYTDYTRGAKAEHIYPINLKEAAFINLKNDDELVKAVLYKAIENTDIARLINLTIVPVVSQVMDTVEAGWGAASTGAKNAWELATLPFKLLFGGRQ